MPVFGALAAAAVCWPFAFWFSAGQPVWWLQIVAMVPLACALRASTHAFQAFTLAWLYALAWLCSTFWWLYVSLHVYGGLAAILSALAVFALAAALAIYYGLAAYTLSRLQCRKPASQAAVFAALWTAAEMARGTWLTGFGWGAMAYAQLDGPLAPWIPIVGAYGVGALAAWGAATIAQLLQASWWQRLVLLVLLACGVMLGSVQSTVSTGSISVALLQGNIPQDEKFDSGTGIPQALSWYAGHMQQEQAKLVLAPETAIPLLPQELPAGYWAALKAQVAQRNSALLTGIPLGDYVQGYTNSVVALMPGTSNTLRYDKHHLVPFGEFIPPMFKWFTRMMNIPLGDFNRGELGQPSFPIGAQRIAPNICYEDLFGEELGARFLDPALSPTMFANVSNLGWFGDTIAIDQHLQISRMRALEFQRPFLRATNTGVTAILNYKGEVVKALPRLTQGVLLGTVEGRSGTTPYAWWVARFGLWPLWLLACLIVAWAWLAACRA
jgi:apolipoprotein N-acyltransferase